ncbi:MAG TPA: hypothetical protein VGH80_14865 [Xanthomonadaceae bacterium]|jgi:hypothetical protein
MQRVLAVVRNFVLPVACFAGSAWAFAFCFMYATLPKRDIGAAILLAFAGIVMSAPWIIMAIGVLQRMHLNAEEAEHEHPPPKDGTV